MHYLSRNLLPALALGTPAVQAFWRLECNGNVGLGRLDPLMAQNSPSDHVHSIKGGSAFSSTSTADDLLKSKCTSCGVKQDLSAYWAPAMYFMSDDGTAELVPEKPPHKTYYLMRGGSTHDGKTQKVEAFPNGFSMIAGNNFRRNTTIPDPDPNPLGPWPTSSQEDLAQRAIGFNCLNYRGTAEPALRRHKLPDKNFLDTNCPDGVRLEMQFPSCWNGELDGGASRKAHVAYPDGVQVGNCPKGFDRRLITLMFETIVATDNFKGKSGRFVLANGDPTGFGYHGDFISAWKGDTLQRALESCDTQLPTGVMKDCPVFELTTDSDKCQLENALPPAIAQENVKGPMKGLANGLQVQPGPGPALPPASQPPSGSNTPNGGTGAGNPQAPASIPPPSPSSSQKPVQQAGRPEVKQKNKIEDAANDQSTPPKTTISVTATAQNIVSPVTPAPANSPPELKPDERILNTVYSTKDNIVYEIVQIVKEVKVVREQNAKRHLQQHVRRHMRHHHKRLEYQ